MFSKKEREGVNVVPWNTEEAGPAVAYSEKGCSFCNHPSRWFLGWQRTTVGASRKGRGMRKRMTVHGMLKEWQNVQVNPTPHFNQHSETTLATHSTGYPGHGGKKDRVPSELAVSPPGEQTGEWHLNMVCCRGLSWFLWEWKKGSEAFLTASLGERLPSVRQSLLGVIHSSFGVWESVCQ